MSLRVKIDPSRGNRSLTKGQEKNHPRQYVYLIKCFVENNLLNEGFGTLLGNNYSGYPKYMLVMFSLYARGVGLLFLLQIDGKQVGGLLSPKSIQGLFCHDQVSWGKFLAFFNL